MARCNDGHEHLTEEGRLKCDSGRLGWFTCRGAEDIERRGGTVLEGHFYHLSDEEAAACNYVEGSKSEKDILREEADAYTEHDMKELFPPGRPPVNPKDPDVLEAIISAAYINGANRTRRKGNPRKCGVKKVFEHELEAALTALDEASHELLRILDMPSGDLSAADCTHCTQRLCNTHDVAFHRTFSGMPAEKVGFENISTMVPRYVLVYRLCTE